MQHLLDSLRAAAEPTRLRMLALCALGELSVTELTQILGQSQPRVSRHLKLLCDAGILDRHREGNWVFHRIAQTGPAARIARTLVELLPPDDPDHHRDLVRLAAIRQQRTAAAAAYFSRSAEKWDQIRSLHVDDSEVERLVLAHVPDGPIRSLLDVGTGTGRMLELLAARVDQAVGVDLSREMLAVARGNLSRANLDNCSVQQADMYRLPMPSESVDLVTVHQVLHFADDPAAALAEAARVLRPGGRLLVVDFARHDLEYLRGEHAHRRLGFAEEEVLGWCRAQGLATAEPHLLRGSPLTVILWAADKPPAVAQDGLATSGAVPTGVTPSSVTPGGGTPGRRPLNLIDQEMVS